MRAYKRLNKSDIIITPLTTNKQWVIPSASFSSSNIHLYRGANASNFDINGIQTEESQSQFLLYRSIQHLYYQNYISASTSGLFNEVNGEIATSQSLESGSYFNFPQSTTNEYRYFPTQSNAVIYVLGIPRQVYGSKIKPETLNIFNSSSNSAITDDGYGNLIYNWYTPSPGTPSTQYIGNVIYPHGIAIFTSQSSLISNFFTGSVTASFKGEHVIYENIIKCTVKESEFNMSQNPSISSGSNGDLRGFATGSIFTPYVTTVGLYNDSQELLAVAKMAQPIPLSIVTDTSFLINMDK